MTEPYEDHDLQADDDDYEDYDFPEDDCESWDDCGLDIESGQCMMAGTEDCDWSCPYSSSVHFAGSRAWYMARGKRPPWDDYLYEKGKVWPKTYRYKLAADRRTVR